MGWTKGWQQQVPQEASSQQAYTSYFFIQKAWTQNRFSGNTFRSCSGLLPCPRTVWNLLGHSCQIFFFGWKDSSVLHPKWPKETPLAWIVEDPLSPLPTLTGGTSLAEDIAKANVGEALLEGGPTAFLSHPRFCLVQFWQDAPALWEKT